MSIKHVVTTTPAVRGLAVVLASFVTASSTALSVGAIPAFAQPVDETTFVETPSAPTEEVVTEAPPVVETPVIPEAPVVTEAPVPHWGWGEAPPYRP